MKNFFNPLLNIIKDKFFYLFLLISLVFFGIFVNFEFSLDTYSVVNNPILETIKTFCTSGRFVTGLVAYVVNILSLKINVIYTLSFLFSVIFITLSQYVLFKILSKELGSPLISILVSILSIINPFSIELFLFIEKGIFALSIFLNILGFYFFLEFIKRKNLKLIIISFIMLFLSLSCYQGVFGLFLILSTIFLLKYSKNFIEFIKNNLILFMLYILPSLLNYILAKYVFLNARLSESNFLLSIKIIFPQIKNMLIKSYNILPQYFFLFFCIVILIITIYSCIKKRTILLSSFSLIYILLALLCITIAPQIMQNPSSVWLVPRSTYVFASLPGILLIFLSLNFKINLKTNKLILIFLSIFLIVQFISFQKIAIDRYILNYMDKTVSLEIQNLINQYETKNNIEIKNIAFYQDSLPSYSYPGLFVSGDINLKAFYIDWSRNLILNFYLNRNLVEVKSSGTIYNKFFYNKNWNSFNDDQIVFDNDTIHICIF